MFRIGTPRRNIVSDIQHYKPFDADYRPFLSNLQLFITQGSQCVVNLGGLRRRHRGIRIATLCKIPSLQAPAFFAGGRLASTAK